MYSNIHMVKKHQENLQKMHLGNHQIQKPSKKTKHTTVTHSIPFTAVNSNIISQNNNLGKKLQNGSKKNMSHFPRKKYHLFSLHS